MSQTSDHQVIVQSEFHTENVKCLIKGKAIGSAGGHETSCLWVQGGPALKSRVILAGKRDVQEDTEKKSGRRGSKSPPKVCSSSPGTVSTSMTEGRCESPGA